MITTYIYYIRYHVVFDWHHDSIAKKCKVKSEQFGLFLNTAICNELGGNMARFTQFPIMITRSTIIYEIISPGAAGSSIYV